MLNINIYKRFVHCAIWREAAGSTIIEYALIAPVLLLLLLGILEYSVVMYGMTVVEGATTEAGRECADAGNATCSQNGYAQYIQSVVAGRVNGLLDPKSIHVSLYGYNTSPTTTKCNFGGASGTLPGCSQNFGTTGQIVLFTVTYPWPIITPLLQNILGANGSYMLSSSTAIQIGS